MYKRIGAAMLVVGILLFGTPPLVYAQTTYEDVEESQEGEETEGTESSATEDTSETSLTGRILSEDGNATLGDAVTSADDKEFITVTTKKGNTFYLVIDHQRDSDNVYFLNMVDESDLQAFIKESGTDLDSIVSLPDRTEIKEETEIQTEEESAATETPETEKSGLKDVIQDNNTNYLIVIGVIGVLGAGYYFKIHKKKQNAFDEYETEDEYEEDDYDEDEDYNEDNDGDQDEQRAEEEQKEEAKRLAKEETDRLAKLEEERLKKEQMKEQYQKFKQDEKKLNEEKDRLQEEQKRLEEEQERILAEQEKFEDWEDEEY